MNYIQAWINPNGSFFAMLIIDSSSNRLQQNGDHSGVSKVYTRKIQFNSIQFIHLKDAIYASSKSASHIEWK